MNTVLSESIINSLKKAFSRNGDILAVYLFGSQITGTANKESDLDMAILVNNREKISEREILSFLQNNHISLPFETDLSCVDLASPPIFLFQIIKNGTCIYEKNPLERADLEAKIMNIYYDNRHLRDIYNHYLQQSLAQGTYGY